MGYIAQEVIKVLTIKQSLRAVIGYSGYKYVQLPSG